MTNKITVTLKKLVDDSYPIFLGSKYIKTVFDNFSDQTACFIVDSFIYEHYYKLFKDKKCFVYDASEENKNIENVVKVIDFFIEQNSLRDDIAVVVGGGITGDVGAFAASLYMRGIKYYNVPTTFLSMVDSSVGGKTGVNRNNIKNTIGTFCQPQAVYIDLDFLTTLSKLDYRNGIAEVIKYAVMFDREFFSLLLDNAQKLLDRDKPLLNVVIKKCIEHKSYVVSQDEKEKGARRFLNLGHTFGHAIEVDSGYEIKHGFAIATGMYLEMLFGYTLQKVKKSSVIRIREILKKYNFSTEYEIRDTELFYKALLQDKKAGKSGLVISIATQLGMPELLTEVSILQIQNFFSKKVII